MQRVRGVRGMIKGCNIFFGLKIAKHLQRCGRAHYRATRKNLQTRTQLGEPVECASGGDPLLLYKILHSPFFPLVRILCALRFESPKIINKFLMRDLWIFSFFGRWDVSPTHSEVCRFVSGSQAKHQVSSLVIILIKKFLSASAIAIMSWQGVIRPSLCTSVKDCGKKPAQNFLFTKSFFRIRRTTVLRIFKDSAIILGAIQWSYLTKSATTAVFTSGRVDFGRPSLSSNSTSSLPALNREYNLRTFDRFTASFPKAFCTNTGVSVANRPALKQNYMTTLCSFPPSMKYKGNRHP